MPDRPKPRRAATVRGHDRFARPPTPVPEPVEDDITPPLAWYDAERLDRLESKIEAYTQTVLRTEAIANKEILPFIHATGARHTELAVAVATVSTNVEALTAAMHALGTNLRERYDDHGQRLEAVEERAADHHVRLALIDDAQLEPRVRTLEEVRAAADAGEKALEKAAKKRGRIRAAVGAAIGTAVGWFTR